jgi:hypothetical protein
MLAALGVASIADSSWVAAEVPDIWVVIGGGIIIGCGCLTDGIGGGACRVTGWAIGGDTGRATGGGA